MRDDVPRFMASRASHVRCDQIQIAVPLLSKAMERRFFSGGHVPVLTGISPLRSKEPGRLSSAVDGRGRVRCMRVAVPAGLVGAHSSWAGCRRAEQWGRRWIPARAATAGVPVACPLAGGAAAPEVARSSRQ